MRSKGNHLAIIAVNPKLSVEPVVDVPPAAISFFNTFTPLNPTAMQFLRKLVFVFLLFAFSLPSFGWWGLTGHRVVGEVAQNYLTSKARKAIHEILGTESLAMASNWADFIKSDSTYDYLGSWHYVNLKEGLTRTEVENKLLQDTAMNLFNRINFLVAELKKDGLAPGTKAMYLRLLIHFVGDLHQPLHVGRLEDLGGNRIKVKWFNETTNLHSVWDERLPEFQKLSYTEFAKAINHTSKKQRKEWQRQPISDWFFESYQLAQEIYDEIDQPEQRLSYHYNYQHVATLNSQLLKGGVRLAGLLNEIFG